MAKTDITAKIVFVVKSSTHICSFLRLLRISKNFILKVLVEHFNYLPDTLQWPRKIGASLLIGTYRLNVYTRKEKTCSRFDQNLKSKTIYKAI